MIAPYYQRGGVELYHSRAEDVTGQFTEKGIPWFDAPYSDHVHSKSRAGARKTPLRSVDGKVGKAAILRTVDFGFASLSAELRDYLARESARLASRWVGSFSDIESCHCWRESFEAHGLDYVRSAAWRKLGGAPQFTGDRPGIGFEVITIAHARGVRKRWNGGGEHGSYSHEAFDPEDPTLDLWYEMPIVLERGGKGRLEVHEPRIHETQKPWGLLVKVLSRFTEPGELVYDFTAGSCTTAIAAWHLGRRCVCVEMREEICERAAQWLEATLSGSTYYATDHAQEVLFKHNAPNRDQGDLFS